MYKRCIYCGGLYIRKNKQQRYCSVLCRLFAKLFKFKKIRMNDMKNYIDKEIHI